jgi:hypothetical protein
MATWIGQFSRHQPAVVYDGSGTLHMVFAANDDSNRILYRTSNFSIDEWILGPEPGQSTSAAPALALFQGPSLYNAPPLNLLVLVFIANDPSNRILFSILDLNVPLELRAWRFQGGVDEESAQAVSVTVAPVEPQEPIPVLNIYFTSNDPSNRILHTRIFPT